MDCHWGEIYQKVLAKSDHFQGKPPHEFVLVNQFREWAISEGQSNRRILFCKKQRMCHLNFKRWYSIPIIDWWGTQ